MIIITNKYKPKISVRELETTKPSVLMKKHNISERGLQIEISKHCGNESQFTQKKLYNEVYKRKEE